MVALFVVAVAVQFAAPEAAVRVMEEANFQGMTSTAITPAASQSAVPAYLAESTTLFAHDIDADGLTSGKARRSHMGCGRRGRQV